MDDSIEQKSRWGRKITQVERMNKNTTLFDQAERERNDGIEASYRNSVPVWRIKAGEALTEVARNKERFTSEDVRLLIASWGYQTRDNRSMGAVMLSATRAGIAEITDTFTPSRLKGCHKRPIRVYKSKLYRGENEQ